MSNFPSRARRAEERKLRDGDDMAFWRAYYGRATPRLDPSKVRVLDGTREQALANGMMSNARALYLGLWHRVGWFSAGAIIGGALVLMFADAAGRL